MVRVGDKVATCGTAHRRPVNPRPVGVLLGVEVGGLEGGQGPCGTHEKLADGQNMLGAIVIVSKSSETAATMVGATAKEKQKRRKVI